MIATRIVVSRTAARQTALRSAMLRRWQSSSSSSSPSSTGQPAEVGPQVQLANIALASALLGFCGFVFTYSMNAVGRADANDPLARLQAEAQEAKDARDKSQARRLTPEEVAALESGMTRRDGGGMEVAVAAPAEIAQLEEEANLRIFRTDNSVEASTKKKPWWRFGF